MIWIKRNERNPKEKQSKTILSVQSNKQNTQKKKIVDAKRNDETYTFTHSHRVTEIFVRR